MRFPSDHSKVSATSEIFSDIEKLPLSEFGEHNAECYLYFEEMNGFRFDYNWIPKKNGSNKLFVLFSGDIIRQKNNPPVFQRWSWSDFFPGHCLFISDPTLYLEDTLTLAWYLGTKTYDPLSRICQSVETVREAIGVREEDVIFYGSSGGGFCALRTISYLSRQKIVAINPQISIARYQNPSVRKYLRICQDGLTADEYEKKFPLKADVTNLIGRLDGQKIIYVQNVLDEHHFNEHFKYFCDAYGSSYEDGVHRDLVKILFSHPGGHGKAETEDVFKRLLCYL